VDLSSIFAIAVGLAMDAFAVSVASGLGYCTMHISHHLRIALFFGAFQAFMPVIGWLAGLSLRDYIAAYDHWIAFVILSILGARMIYEATVLSKAEKDANILNLMVLIGLSIATSIDALAVGITFAFLNVTIVLPVIIIGVVTFAMSYIGVIIGKRCVALEFSTAKIEVLGGLVLIAIGIKILAEHLIKGI
jgi:putative Mn2+ efflux pump MntP